MGASCSGYLCSGCRPRDKEPDTAAPREGLQGRKEQPLHTDGAPPQPERPSAVRSLSPPRKGATLPGQTPRAPRPRLATALAPTTLRGAGVGNAPLPWLVQPRGLRGNRRRAREEGGKHEERGFLRAETGVDAVGEGGCGRRRGRGWCAGSTPGGFLSFSWVPGSDASRESPRFLGVPAGHTFPQVPPNSPKPIGPQEGTYRLPPPCHCGG